MSTLPHDSFDANLPKVSYDAPTYANSFTSGIHLSDVRFLCLRYLSSQWVWHIITLLDWNVSCTSNHIPCKSIHSKTPNLHGSGGVQFSSIPYFATWGRLFWNLWTFEFNNNVSISEHWVLKECWLLDTRMNCATKDHRGKWDSATKCAVICLFAVECFAHGLRAFGCIQKIWLLILNTIFSIQL